MPAYPDRDTLRLRPVDRRTPAEAAALARRELAPRLRHRDLPPGRGEHGLPRQARRLASFRERYPGVAERFHPGVVHAATYLDRPAPGEPPRRPCGWDLARAWSRRYGKPAPRVDQLGRLLLGDPCPDCQAALGWHPPKPKPKPKPAARSRKPAARKRAGSSTAARSSTTTTRGGSRTVRVPALLAGANPAGVTAEQAKYNTEALERMRMDPRRWPHLTRASR